MEIDWSRVYRVILNDKFFGYKPTFETLKELGMKVPKAQVIGFGQFGFMNMWFLLVYSPTFPEYHDLTIPNINWKSLGGFGRYLPRLPPPDGDGGPKAS